MKQWYDHSLLWVQGDWRELQNNFYLAFFPISCIVHLCLEVLNFQHKEKKSLGASWARFTNLATSGVYLTIPEPILMQHFSEVLRRETTRFLNITSCGSFMHVSDGEGRIILNKSLKTLPILVSMMNSLRNNLDMVLQRCEEKHLQRVWILGHISRRLT